MTLLVQGERRRALLEWPQAIDDRLDVLIRAAMAAGTPVSRSQMLAALVAAAPTAPAELADILRRYRTAPLEAFVSDNERGDLPTVRRPGPRRKHGGRTAAR